MIRSLGFICFFFCFSCEFELNKKTSVEEYIAEELKYFSWSEIDQYPVFENCIDIDDIQEKNNCFPKVITEEFKLNLENNNLVLNKTLVDTIKLVLRIDKFGKISIDKIEVSDKISDYKDIIVSSFDSTVYNLPKLYPAIKRGQVVDVTFDLPILLSTE